MTQNNRGRRLAITAVSGALAAILGAVSISLSQWHPPAPRPTITAADSLLPAGDTVATIDGIAIPARELQIFLDKDRAQTLTHFQTTFHAEPDENFWSTTFGNTTPTAYLIDTALDDIARSTAQLQWAMKYHLTPADSYDFFLTQLKKENQRRKHAVATHQPIYGPTQYTEANYFDYLQAQYSFDLQERMRADGTITVGQPQLASFLATHPDIAATAQPQAGQSSADALERIAKLYVEQEYNKLLAQAASRLSVVRTPALTTLSNGGCARSGTCATFG